MEEAQYDIPWELKTRNFNALRARPHSTNEQGPSQTGGLVKISPSMVVNERSPPLIMHQSTPPITHLNNSTSPSTSASTPSPSGGDPRVRSACIPSAQLAFRPTANYPRVQVEQKRSPEFWQSASVQAPIPAPRHQHNYQNQHYPPPMISTGTATNGLAHELNGTTSLDTPLPNRRHRVHFDESAMVHEQMDRVEAEKRLEARQVGDYLLRRRADGSLAMSLRASDTVLHIKLERRDSAWVLGEGPAFRTVGSILRAYCRTELPIRGAEHVRLREPICTD